MMYCSLPLRRSKWNSRNETCGFLPPHHKTFFSNQPINHAFCFVRKHRTFLHHSSSCSAFTSTFFFFSFPLLLFFFFFFFRASLFTLNCSSFLFFFLSAVSFARRACAFATSAFSRSSS